MIKHKKRACANIICALNNQTLYTCSTLIEQPKDNTFAQVLFHSLKYTFTESSKSQSQNFQGAFLQTPSFLNFSRDRELKQCMQVGSIVYYLRLPCLYHTTADDSNYFTVPIINRVSPLTV